MGSVSFTVEGIDEFKAALQALARSSEAATEDGLIVAVEETRTVIQRNLSLRTWPPASPAGTPPAFRTGALHDAVLVSGARDEGDGVYEARTWPSLVYARIQELGGWAGAGHRSYLPPRPYVEPALAEMADRVREILAGHWSEALGGG